jgi:hypothetical protein
MDCIHNERRNALHKSKYVISAFGKQTKICTVIRTQVAWRNTHEIQTLRHYEPRQSTYNSKNEFQNLLSPCL